MTVKNNVLWYILRSLEVSMQALVLFVITLMLFGKVYTLDNNYVVFCLGVSAVPVLILYLARWSVKQNLLLLFVHMGIGGFLVTRGTTAEERLAYWLLCIVLLIYSFSLCGKNHQVSQEKIPIGFGCIFLIAIIFGIPTAGANIGCVVMYAGGFFLILQILYKNYDSVNKYIMLNHGIANFPIRQVVAVNSFQMMILVSFFVGVMLIVGSDRINKMTVALGSLLWGIVKSLLRIFFSVGKDLEQGSSFVSEGMETNGIGELHAIANESFLTDIWNGLSTVVGSFVGVGVVVGLCVAVTVGITKGIRNLSGESVTDSKEFLVPGEMREFQIRSRSRKKNIGKGTNAKVRKLYKARVEKETEHGNNKTKEIMTASEITGIYLPDASEMVTSIYQKARYGKNCVTNEEVDIFKKELTEARL